MRQSMLRAFGSTVLAIARSRVENVSQWLHSPTALACTLKQNQGFNILHCISEEKKSSFFSGRAPVFVRGCHRGSNRTVN